MRPVAFITGVLLGTSSSIALGLSVVTLLFFVLADDYPRLADELGILVRTTVAFLLMTAICAVGFIGVIKEKTWRLYAQAAMWAGVGAMVWYVLEYLA